MDKPVEDRVNDYTVDVPLRWSDMDAYAHVNNVQFLRLLEDAWVVAFEDWFGQDRSLLDEGVLVARHEIEYLAPLTFRRAPLPIRMWTRRITATGFDVGYEVAERDGGTVYARAETTLVLYDFTHARPRRMNPELRANLERYEGGEVAFRWRRR